MSTNCFKTLGMGSFGENLSKHLERCGYSSYKLALRISEDPALISKIVSGKRPASERIMKLISEVDDLEITMTTLKGWKALDDYTPEEIEVALEAVLPNYTAPDGTKYSVSELLKALLAHPDREKLIEMAKKMKKETK